MKRIAAAVLTLVFVQSCALRADAPRSTSPTAAEGDEEVQGETGLERRNEKQKRPLDFGDVTIEGSVDRPRAVEKPPPPAGPHGNPAEKEPARDPAAQKELREKLEIDGKDLRPESKVAKPEKPPEQPKPLVTGESTNGTATGKPVTPTSEPRGEREVGTLLQHYGVNPTIDTAAEPVSTFAADVDTGSYTLARAYLERNQLPPEAAVRVEEFVNAFDYAYRPPEKEAFSVQVEAFPSPYRKGYHVLHVGLKGREVKAEQRKSANLVFVIDVSGSMQADNRLPMAKKAMAMLTDQLRPDDSVSVVVYGTTAHVVLPPTAASNKSAIKEALASLHSEGSTNVQAGLELAYSTALKGFKGGGINRVILCSDGVANNGITQADGIFAKVKGRASEGITLTTVGFGMGSYNDVLMERLADQGDGSYAYVDKLDEAKRIFVEQLTGTLEVIAKDVKLQLEFNPEAVERYRLLGFENRALKKEDFANDKIDAGEIGAGHAVTAIYEVKLRSRSPKYFATFRARFKQPQGGASALVEKSLPMEVVRDSVNQSTGPTRLSTVAAGFAEKLRGSYWARNLSWEELLATWESLPGGLKEAKQSQELKALILTAKRLDTRPDRWEREMPLAQMDFDRIPVLR